MNSQTVRKQVERYQKAASQQEQDELLYQIAISSKLLRAIEVNQIAERGGALLEEQRQRVLGFVEAYFGLDLGRT